MKEIYFENQLGERRLLAKKENDEQVWQVINNFLTQHRYNAPYIRTWEQDGEKWYDVGSWSEFFIVRPCE